MAFNKLNVVIGANIESLQKELAKVEKSLQRFGRKMQQIGTDLTQTLTVPIAGLGAASLKAFSDIERLEKGLIALMGSSEAAKAEMVKLREVAKLPGLGFEEAIKGSVSLQAVGFSADKARETLLAFGKAVAVSGGTREDFNEVIYQLAQMNSKGKILAEDFKVLQSRIPILGTLLQDAFGTRNIAQIRDSGVGAAEFTQRIIDAANKSQVLSNVTGGLGNAFENFKDSAKIAFATLGQSLATAFDAQGFLDRLANAIQTAVDAFSRLSPATQKFIAFAGLAVAAVGPLVLIIGKLASLGALFTTGLTSIGAALGFLISPVGLVVAGIAALTAGLVYAYRNSEQFRDFIDRLAASMKVAFQAIGVAAGVLFEAFKKNLNITIEVFKVFANVAIAAFNSIYPYIKPLIDAIVLFGSYVLKYGIEYAKLMAAAYVGAFNAIIKGFTEVFTVIKEKATAIGKGITQILQGNFKEGLSTLTTNTDGSFFETAKRIGTSFSDGFKDGFKGTYKVFDDIAAAYVKGAEKAKAAQKANPVSFISPTSGGLPGSASSGGGKGGGGKGSENALESIRELIQPIGEVQNGLQRLLTVEPLFQSFKALFADRTPINGLQQIQTGAERSSASLDKVALSTAKLGVEINKANIPLQQQAYIWKNGTDAVSNYQAAIVSFNEGLASLIQGSLADFAAGFGDFIGGLLSGSQKVSGFFPFLLNNIATVLDQLGKLAIAAGVAVLGIKKALESLNPFVAIAAGTALIALSSLVRNKAQKLAKPFANGGIAYGPTLGLVGEYPGARTNPEVIAPLDKLKKIIGGGGNGGFIAETVISGSDLRVILSRADKTYTRYTTG